MDGEWIAALIFYGIIGLIIYINRKKFEWLQGIILAYKTKKPLEWMDKLRPGNIFWKIYGTICIPLCAYYMPQLVYLLGVKAWEILINPASGAGVALAIPGVRIPGSPIYIPLFYGVISIGVLALVHEMAHGIIGKSENVRIKSSGFGMFLIFPLFFVEPDDKSLMKASKLSRLRMISAGAGTNIILSFLIFVILSATLLPFLENNSISEGIRITSVTEGLPASKSGLTSGTIILEVNNDSISNLTTFNEAIRKYKPNDTVILNTSTGKYNVTFTQNPNNASLPYMGIYTEEVVDYTLEAKAIYGTTLLDMLRVFFELLVWIAFLNFSIGIMNLLPIWGLDGSKIFYDLVSYLTGDAKAKSITSAISGFCLALLIINILPFFIGLIT